ncbi:Hypothetical protein PHPALM_37952, partial [Phytophthora palmivora]
MQPSDLLSLFSVSSDDESLEIPRVPNDSADSGAVSEVSSIMSSDSEDDLNEIEEGEDPEEYGDLDSGDESAEDDIIDEDDPDAIVEDEVNGITNEELEDGDTEDPNSVEAISERHFAEKFMESLGGSEKVLVGDVMGQDMDKVRDHSVNGWSDPVYPDVYEYLQTPYE